MEPGKNFLQMVISVIFYQEKTSMCKVILNLPQIFNSKRLTYWKSIKQGQIGSLVICLLYVLTLADVLKYLAEKKQFKNRGKNAILCLKPHNCKNL